MRQSRNYLQTRKWRMIFAWVAIITACFSVMIVSAKYKAPHNSVKRVTVTGKSATIFFSSNYLAESITKNGVSVEEDFTGDTNFDIKICNTDVLKPVEFYSKAINYTLTAEVVKENGTSFTASELDAILGSAKIGLYRLEGGAVSGAALHEFDSSHMTYTLSSESLVPTAANPSAMKQYRLVMPEETISKGVYVRVTATPASGYSDLPTSISGSFYVRRKTFNLTTGWTGAFNDDESIGIAQYDGFNYAITGGGTATKTLSWDSTILEVDWKQIQEVFSYTGSQPSADANGIISIPVNLSSESGGRYDIQFYVTDKTARTTINAYTWTQLETLVTLE